MEIENIGLGLMELLNTFFGSFDPEHNAIQFAILFISLFGMIAIICSFIFKKGV